MTRNSGRPSISLKRGSETIPILLSGDATLLAKDVYQFVTSQPVQEEDSLAVIIPTEAELSIYYLTNNGPINYNIKENRTDSNDYPLISALVGQYKYIYTSL